MSASLDPRLTVAAMIDNWRPGPDWADWYAEAYAKATSDDVAVKVDDLAERALTLGGRPVATMKEQLQMSRLHEDAEPPNALNMVRNVYTDLNLLTVWTREVAAQAAEGEDAATANLLGGMADGQEKGAWMLRSFLEE